MEVISKTSEYLQPNPGEKETCLEMFISALISLMKLASIAIHSVARETVHVEHHVKDPRSGEESRLPSGRGAARGVHGQVWKGPWRGH